MILIQTSEIKTFLKRSSKIKTYPTLPVLSYWKLECTGDTATLTKTNMDSWCIHQIEAEWKENQTILIDEKIINAIIANGSDDLMSITQEGDNIIIASGKANASYALQDPTLYPEPPAMNQENGLTNMPPELLYAIRAATSIIDTSTDDQYTRCYINYVNGKTEVFSTRRAHVVYKRTFDERYPSFIISPEVSAMICMFEEVQHYESGNYDFFDCGKTTYGFVKSHYTVPGYSVLFRNSDNATWFEVSRQDLLQFCELVNGLTIDPAPAIDAKDCGIQGVTFKYDNSLIRTSTKIDLPGEKNYALDHFRFNSRVLIPLLKTLDTDIVRFSPAAKGVYCVWSPEDAGLLTLIAGML